MGSHVRTLVFVSPPVALVPFMNASGKEKSGDGWNVITWSWFSLEMW